MYNMTEGWLAMYGKLPTQNWDGKFYCVRTDAGKTFRTNEIGGFLACYTFTLVRDGWLKFRYNGQEMTIYPDYLLIYSPGVQVEVIDASENYKAICLMADEQMTIASPTVHDLVQIAYMPIVQLHEPMMHLPPNVALEMEEKMDEMITYLHSSHIYKAKILQMLYAVFLLNLQDIQEVSIVKRRTSQRSEDIFIGFIRLLPHHFSEHRNIAFYADALHISSVYLSRVVREVSGRTVMDYINQMVVMEASFLLRTSSLSISQIAHQLHFADPPSFSKFFSRLMGKSPREYREQ